MSDRPPVDKMPHVNKGLLQFITNPVEKAQLVYIKQLNQTLFKEVPRAAGLPLVYLGSGGDLRMPLILTDPIAGTKIVMINDGHFLRNAKGGNFSLTGIHENVEKTPQPGAYTPQNEVEPGRQMMSDLFRLGINPVKSAKTEIQADGSAALQFSIPELMSDQMRQIEVDYHNIKIEDIKKLRDVLAALDIPAYGLLCKAQSGAGVFSLLNEWARQTDWQNYILPPHYIVIDDPQLYVGTNLTKDRETPLFPGYELKADVRSGKVNLGYSWWESEGETYKSRFLIFRRTDATSTIGSQT